MTEHSDATEPQYEVIVIGAGVCGIYTIYKLTELGVRATVIETGADLGGTWYWNRYPGARFDSESITYGYSFSDDLLQEWDWKERFSGQPENLRYLNYVADKFDLRRHMQFNLHGRVHGRSTSERPRWTVHLDDGRELTCRFLITAVGLLSAPTLPRYEGMDTFEGRSFHTFDWPQEPVDLTGKRVAVIGTGATGIQVIGEIADKVGDLTVFQRRPNWAAPLHNAEISAEEMADIKARYDEIFAICPRTPGGFVHEPDRRPFFEVPREERLAMWEKLYDEPGFGIWLANFREIFMDEAANAEFSEFIADKIRVPRERPGRRREADPQGPRLRRAAGAAGDQLLRGLQPGQRAPGRPPGDADRADHPDGHPHHRARLRVRHHRVRHRLRRHHRLLRPHRHPRRRRAQAADKWADRPRRPISACRSTASPTC